MRKIVTLLALMFTSLALPALGQTMTQTLRFSVPFEFIVGSKTLPAGDYEVCSRGNGVLELMNEQSRKTRIAFLSYPTQPPFVPDRSARIVFQRYGSHVFLSQIWGEGAATGFELPGQRRLLRELYTASAPAPETLILTAKR